MRIEKDFLGEKLIEDNALYGIHALRAKENFDNQSTFPIEWYKSVGIVKKSCYIAYQNFKKTALTKYKANEIPIKFIDDKILYALITVCNEIIEGKYFEHFIVPGIQGGAGTSINMNINEIIANAALLKLGKKTGEYKIIDPVETANIFQSTNDVIPTSLKICIIELLKKLESLINTTREKLEFLERTYRNELRIGYTQMQEAVPSTFGKLFSAYNDALSRDWWRISKCFERIKEVNIGGGAIGTGIGNPRFFTVEVIQTLQNLTQLPITKSENLVDTTSNLDTFVEIDAILKSHAVNLEKISSDIRLLGSDITGNQLKLPQTQVGSSIMPAKINPVIVEYVISCSQKVFANDNLISSLCAKGCLELNAYLPLIGISIIENINLLNSANKSITEKLFENLIVNTELAKEKLLKSPSITTVLVPYIGYNACSSLSKEMKTHHIDIYEANELLKVIEPLKLREILSNQSLLLNSFALQDILNEKK